MAAAVLEVAIAVQEVAWRNARSDLDRFTSATNDACAHMQILAVNA